MTTPKKESAFDVRDGVFFAGMLIAAAGGAMLSLPWTLVVLGAVLALKANGPIVTVRRSEE